MYNNGYGGYGNGGYAGNGYGGSYGGGYANSYGGGDDYDDIGMDLSQTEEYTGSTLLPNGEYPVCIKNAQRKDGRQKPYLNVTYVVTEGQYKGCQVYESFFLWADNPEFAKQRFKALRHAIGLNPNVGGKISELPGKEFLASVKQRNVRDRNTRELTSELENVVSAYLPLTAAMPASAPIQAPTAPVSPATPMQQAPQAPRPAAAPASAPAPAQAPQAPRAQGVAQAPQAPVPPAAPQAAPAAQAPVGPSEYAQAMSSGPEPQEVAFPAPEGSPF